MNFLNRDYQAWAKYFHYQPALHLSHTLKHAVMLDCCTLKHTMQPSLAVNLEWCCIVILSFRSIEQFCSQHSSTVVRHGSPSIIMSADLVISISTSFCSAWRTQCHYQIRLLNTINSVNVYQSLLDSFKYICAFLYCVTKLGWNIPDSGMMLRLMCAE